MRVITINFLRALNMKLLEEVKPRSDVLVRPHLDVETAIML